MGNRKTTDGGRIREKPWWKRWSRDDTELFLLSLPTLTWFLIFLICRCLVSSSRSKIISCNQEGMVFSTICCTVNGRVLETLNISLHQTHLQCF